MKIRTDFVTNSSSSSFIFDKTWDKAKVERLLLSAYKYADKLYQEAEQLMKSNYPDLWEQVVKYFSTWGKFIRTDTPITDRQYYKDKHKLSENKDMKYVMSTILDKFNKKFGTDLKLYEILESYLCVYQIHTILYMSRNKTTCDRLIDLDNIDDVNLIFNELCNIIAWYDIGEEVFRGISNDDLYNIKDIHEIYLDEKGRYCRKVDPWDCEREIFNNEDVCRKCKNGPSIKEVIIEELDSLGYSLKDDTFKLLLIEKFKDNIGTILDCGEDGFTDSIALAIYYRYCKYKCAHMG